MQNRILEIIGNSLDTNNEPPPIDSSWYTFPTGSGSVKPLQTDAKFISDPWIWIILRVKRTSSGNNAVFSVGGTGLPRV